MAVGETSCVASFRCCHISFNEDAQGGRGVGGEEREEEEEEADLQATFTRPSVPHFQPFASWNSSSSIEMTRLCRSKTHRHFIIIISFLLVGPVNFSNRLVTQ